MTAPSTVPETIRYFLTLFADLSKCCDNAPEKLFELCNSQPAVADLCSKINETAAKIRDAQSASTKSFSFPPDSTFRSKWREYINFYETAVWSICLKNSKDGQFVPTPLQAVSRSLDWTYADIVARDYSLQLTGLILATQIHPKATSELLKRVLPEDINPVETTTEVNPAIAWEALIELVGLAPVPALRRRQLIPHLLLPQKWAIESATKMNLLRNLEDAQRSFIFGSALAALVLMRSTMESALRDCYGSGGKDLEQRIDNATDQLPEGVSTIALQRLRKLANKIVHLNSRVRRHNRSADEKWIERMSTSLYKTSNQIASDEERWVETEIVYLFGVLRNLIEAAPNN